MFAKTIQACYDGEPTKLRAQYVNPAALKLDIEDLSHRLANWLPDYRRDTGSRAIYEVLAENCPGTRPKPWRSAFGIAVAAKFFDYSTRQIHTILAGAPD